MAEKNGHFIWFKSLSRPRKNIFWLGSAVLCYTIFGFLAAPLILKMVLESKLPPILHRQVAIEKIRLNPYTLSATIEGFSLAKKSGAGPFIYFDRLHVNLEGRSIFKRALIVKSISVAGPIADFAYLGEKTFSFSDLLNETAAPKETPADQGPAHFSINNIEITSGNIKFNDLAKGKAHQITDLNLAIPSISNLPGSIEIFVQPAFSAVINGTSTSLGGQTKPFADSLATEIDIRMSGINIPEYLAYIPNPTGLALKAALMDIDARLTYLARNDNTARLSLTGEVTVRGIDVVDQQDKTYFRLPALTLVLADSNLLAKEVHLARIAIDSPQIEVLRLANGDILPLTLLAPGSGDRGPDPAAEKPADGEDPFRVTIDSLDLSRGGVVFQDQVPETPAGLELSKISLQASTLANIPETIGRYSFGMLLNETGKINGEGTLVLDPFSLTSLLDLNSIDLKNFQPYVADQMRIIMTDGTAALQGELTVKQEPGAAAALTFSGSSAVENLAASDTLIGDDLLKWRSLKISDIKFSSTPPLLAIGEIGWQDPYAKILVNDDGAVNLATLRRNEPAKEKEEAAESGARPTEGEDDLEPSATARPQITIARISLANGQIQFQDRNIKPAYQTSLTDLNGAVTGLSSAADTPAAVRFNGKVDQQAFLEISGELDPLVEDQYADIKIDFTDFNLSPLSPYTGKFIGYKTGKGKLNLDLSYRLTGRQLDSTNKAFLDQFSLGEKVASPDATSLPVSLAISLLKNRQGEIFLDVPVSGDLDDPEFSIGVVIVRIIVNLITKAATSPFALLGSLIPEGVDLQHIIFAAGSGDLSGDAVTKLDLLTNVLYERPGLNMDIVGWVDPVLDRQALTRNHLEKQLRLAKLKGSGPDKNKAADYQNMTISAAEYPAYLQLVYNNTLAGATAEKRRAAKALKPGNPAEAQKMMEEFLLAEITINAGDLRLLAIERANRILSYLSGTGKVEAGRLFLVEPALAETVATDGGQGGAMVELKIK